MDRIKESNYCKIFEYFKEMNEIPRESANEKEVSDWLVDFAKDRNLEVIQDEALNVIIKKEGSKGYEDSPILVLQGHMDMVAEKTSESDHDFEKDPIEFIIDGDYIRANDTTLGADNGIAVAYALAILDSDDIDHPPLEVLITSEEEIGMNGAFALNPDNIKGRQLINLDSEKEGELLVSCAGGIGSLITLDVDREEGKYDSFYEISISGLKGGHSGMEIHKERANAIKLLARILYRLGKESDYSILSLNGGSKHNAIPSHAYAIINMESSKLDFLRDLLEEFKSNFDDEFKNIEGNIDVKVKEVKVENKKVLTESFRKKVLAIISLIPSGIINMSNDIEGLVQTSNNLAVVETMDDMVSFESSTRSSLGSMKYAFADKLEIIAKTLGAKIKFGSIYPEWQYKDESRLRDCFIKTYEDLYGQEPLVTAIHAGLECGVFDEKFDGQIDLISFGPNINNAHTPREEMEIESVERTYDLLKGLLSNLK